MRGRVRAGGGRRCEEVASGAAYCMWHCDEACGGAWIIFPAFFTLHVRSPSSPKKELAATVTRHPISPYARLVFLMTTQTAKCGAERVMDGCHP